MPFWFPAVTNKEISQIIKQAVPEIHEKGDGLWFGSFNRKSFEFSDETGEKIFCLQMQIELKSLHFI